MKHFVLQNSTMEYRALMLNVYIPYERWTLQRVGCMHPSKAIVDNCFTGLIINSVASYFLVSTVSNTVNTVEENDS